MALGGLAIGLGAGSFLGNIFGGIFQARSAKKAAKIMANAIKTCVQWQLDALDKAARRISNDLDPQYLDPIVYQQDIAAHQRRLAFLKEYDPELYSVYQTSQRTFRELVQAPSEYVKELGNAEFNQRLSAVQKALLERAEENLRLGGSLSPDVQAELVSAGLAQAGAAGLRPSAGGVYGAAGPLTAQVLGLAGEQLRQQRAAQAAGYMSQAQQTEQSRGQYLANLRAQELGTQYGAVQGALGMAPELGLSGRDYANLITQRSGLLAQLYGQQGQVAGQGALQLGQVQANYINNVANAISDAIKGALGAVAKTAGAYYAVNNPGATNPFGGFLT